MRIWKTTDPLPKSSTDAYHIYNALDTCVTHEVHGVLDSQLDEVTRKVYNNAVDLQAAVLEMDIRGVKVDIVARDDMIRELNRDITFLEDSLIEILREGLGVNTVPTSPQQLAELLYDIMGLPIQRDVKTGSRTVNRKALDKLKQYFYAKPILNHILLIRDLAKQVSTLRTSIDNDGRVRTSFSIAGTDTGRLSSYASANGTGCLLGEVEVLTPEGWRRIDSIQAGDVILQYNDGVAQFTQCEPFKTAFFGNLLKVSGEQLYQCLTPNHRVLHKRWQGEYKIASAKEVSRMAQAYIPLAGEYQPDDYIEYVPPYAAMLMADGSFEEVGWRLAFKKQRKIDRFLALAEEFGFAFTEQKAREGFRRFYVPGHKEIRKYWGSWILNLSQENLSQLVEEARYWDAHDRGSGFIFYSANKESAEWFATAAHLSGKSCSIRKQEQHERSWSDTVIWCVNVKSRDFAQVMKKHWKEVPYKGDVYCVTVPSSTFFIRDHGFISVTGNTNLQNIDPRLRKVFVADEGMRFAYIDLEQAESRAVGAIEWNLFHDGRYLDACESADLHTTVARMAWPHHPWTGDIKVDKKLAKSITMYREDDIRQGAKKLSHASNYGGRAQEIARQLGIPVEVVGDFQPKYFRSFPAHNRWHAWVATKLSRDGWITSLMGRRRTFFGRRWENDTIKAAIAYDPQSSVCDYLSEGIRRLWRENICQILLQVHDAILVQYPEELENIIVPRIQKILEIEVPLLHDRTLVIPTEAVVGWNWGYYDKDKNPNGLRPFTGSDERKRTHRSTLDLKFSEA